MVERPLCNLNNAAEGPDFDHPLLHMLWFFLCGCLEFGDIFGFSLFDQDELFMVTTGQNRVN